MQEDLCDVASIITVTEHAEAPGSSPCMAATTTKQMASPWCVLEMGCHRHSNNVFGWDSGEAEAHRSGGHGD